MKPRSIAAAAFLLALAPSPAEAAPRASVTIALTSHRYTPSPIYLSIGVPVRMIFLNRAGKDHDFTAREFFAGARILRGRAPGGEIRIGAGRSAVVDLIPRRGTYKVHCGEFGHRMLGMSTMIIVQ